VKLTPTPRVQDKQPESHGRMYKSGEEKRMKELGKMILIVRNQTAHSTAQPGENVRGLRQTQEEN
jgi:hypothetical protein